MNWLKRAVAYVKRRPAKTILLMITFFLIGNLVILGLGISQAAENAKTLTRKSMRAAVSYEVDYDAYWAYIDTLTDQDEINEAYNNYPQIDAAMAQEIAQDERVLAYNYMTTSVFYSVGFDNVPLGNESQRGDMGTITVYDEEGNPSEVEYTEPNIMVYANNTVNMIEMADGTFTLEDGRWISQEDLDSNAQVVCITRELADQNNFKVGDTLTMTSMASYDLQNMSGEDITAEDFQYDFEIIGIYSTVNELDPSDENFQWASPYESPKNVVLIPFGTLVEINVKNTLLYQQAFPQYYEGSEMDEEQIRENSSTPSTVVYLLDDPLEVDQFVRDHETTLAEYTRLNANDDAFKKNARPLDTLSFFSNILVWIVVINAIVIISLVTALTLKTREFEIGVMLSMGVSKLKVVAQLFMELFIIALIGFSLSVVSGSLIAGKVGDAVLEFQTTSNAQYEDNTDDYYVYSDQTDYFTDVTQEEMLAQYHVEVSGGLILTIYLLGTAVVLVSIVVPAFMIMRLNPKQILLEQN